MVCKPKLHSHVDLGFQKQRIHSARSALWKASKVFWLQPLIALGAPPPGRPGTWTSCSSWATWPRTTWPLSPSGVRAAASTNICTCRRPSSRCSSWSTSPARRRRAWSEWALPPSPEHTGLKGDCFFPHHSGLCLASFSYFLLVWFSYFYVDLVLFDVTSI